MIHSGEDFFHNESFEEITNQNLERFSTESSKIVDNAHFEPPQDMFLNRSENSIKSSYNNEKESVSDYSNLKTTIDQDSSLSETTSLDSVHEN